MQMLKIILFILLVILVAIFVSQNKWITTAVSIKYYSYAISEIPLWIILLIFFFLGTLLSTCCYIVNHSKLKRILYQNKKRITQMEKELVSLRNLPITENQEEKSSSIQTL